MQAITNAFCIPIGGSWQCLLVVGICPQLSLTISSSRIRESELFSESFWIVGFNFAPKMWLSSRPLRKEHLVQATKREVAKGWAKQICNRDVFPMTFALKLEESCLDNAPLKRPWTTWQSWKSLLTVCWMRKLRAELSTSFSCWLPQTVPGQGDGQLVPLVPLPLRIHCHWILRTCRSSGDGFSTWLFNQGCFGSLCQNVLFRSSSHQNNRQSTTSDNQETKGTHGKPTCNHPANSSV